MKSNKNNPTYTKTSQSQVASQANGKEKGHIRITHYISQTNVSLDQFDRKNVPLQLCVSHIFKALIFLRLYSKFFKRITDVLPNYFFRMGPFMGYDRKN